MSFQKFRRLHPIFPFLRIDFIFKIAKTMEKEREKESEM